MILRLATRSSRTGHTLLEILLALGLSLVLLSAAYSAIELHWRYSNAGQLETEQSQIARAVLEQISRDLRGAVFAKPPLPNSAVDRTSQPRDNESRAVGIVGNAQECVVDVCSYTYSTRVEDETRSRPRNNGWRYRVHWHIAEDIQAEELRELHLPVPEASTEVKALVRQMRAVGEVNLSPMNRFAPDDLVASEIQTINFRYFDGQQWQLEWDGGRLGALPVAVEVTVFFGEADMARENSVESPRRYQLVIAIANPGV